MKHHLIIWGAGGHAAVLADMASLGSNVMVVGFVDEIAGQQGTELSGLPVFRSAPEAVSQLGEGVRHALIGVGDNPARLAIAQRLRTIGFDLVTMVHPRATVAASSSLGAGTVIMAGAIANPRCIIGDNVIINTGATVDHDCVLEDGVHIGPGAHLGGRVHVERGAWVGIGAIVKDRIRIGAGSIIGAGAVVVRDIPAGVVAYGVPCRVMRKVNESHP